MREKRILEGGLFKVRRGRKVERGWCFLCPSGDTPAHLEVPSPRQQRKPGGWGDCGAPPSWTSPLGPHSHRPLPPWGLWLQLLCLLLFRSLFSWSGASLAVPPLRQSTKVNASSVLGSMELGGCCTEGCPAQYRQALSPQDLLLPAHLEPLADTGEGTFRKF